MHLKGSLRETEKLPNEWNILKIFYIAFKETSDYYNIPFIIFIPIHIFHCFYFFPPYLIMFFEIV